MSNTISTPYMSLALPIPTVEVGPLWASDLNAAMTLIDSHTHVPGQGQPVPTAGLNINADLPFGGFNALNLRSVRMANQSSALSAASDIGCLFVSGGDLWYNSSSGQQVHITSGGTLNISGVGGISGLAGTNAAVTYSSISNVFTFTQNSGITAAIAGGPLSISQMTSGANSITLQSPNSLAANYNITLPVALPASTNFLAMDSSGNISATFPVNGLTTTNLSNSANITGTQLSASAAIAGTQLAANANIQLTQLVSVPTIASSTITAYSNFTTSYTSIVSLTLPAGAAAGRILMVSFANPTTNEGQIGVTVSASFTPTDAVYRICTIRSGGSQNNINTQSVSNNMADLTTGLLSGNVLIPSSSINTMYIIQAADIVAGALTVQVFGRVTVQSVAGGSATFCVMNNTIMTLTVI